MGTVGRLDCSCLRSLRDTTIDPELRLRVVTVAVAGLPEGQR